MGLEVSRAVWLGELTGEGDAGELQVCKAFRRSGLFTQQTLIPQAQQASAGSLLPAGTQRWEGRLPVAQLEPGTLYHAALKWQSWMVTLSEGCAVPAVGQTFWLEMILRLMRCFRNCRMPSESVKCKPKMCIGDSVFT